MAVYYKFKSEKKHNSICVDDHFITVACLKERIFESSYVSSGTDRDLEITNAQTNEVYIDETMLIPKNTFVLLRRIPRNPRGRYIAHQNESEVEFYPEYRLPMKSDVALGDVSCKKDVEPSKLDDEFGPEIYAPFPEPTPAQASNAVQYDPALTKDDEDSRLKALIETPALNWQSKANTGFGVNGRFERGGSMMAGQRFGRIGFQWEKPPQGYVCHRCNEPGHFIQHCPTNGDPNYDVKRVKPPTGIPKTMLMPNPDGSYVLPNGGVATVKPDESTFEREIGRIPTTYSQGDFPPELYCLLCKEVIKDAVLTSKCCFKSYCDKCIRDYFISKSICVCGAKDMLADDLIPNKTLRDTINRILESSSSSSGNLGSGSLLQDKKSAWCPQPKSASPTQSSSASKGAESANEERSAVPPTQQNSDKLKTAKVIDILETTHDSAGSRESTPQGRAPSFGEELQKTEEVRKKKKKARSGTPQQCRDNFMMPMCPSTMYTGSFGSTMPFPCVLPNVVPFMGQNPLFHMAPPQMDASEFSCMGWSVGPRLLTREEFGSGKINLKRKRVREVPKDVQNTAPSCNKRKSEHHSLSVERSTRRVRVK